MSQPYTTLHAATAGGERVLELLDTVPEVTDRPDAVDIPLIQGRIELCNVSFAYRENVPVLHDIQFAIQPDQTVALVGPTGAGKSSMANLITRFYEVSEGCVKIDGWDLRAVKLASLHRQMGLVPQDPFLFSGTIADNIRFGRPDAMQEEIVAAAHLANAHQFMSALPAGYNTEILEGASTYLPVSGSSSALPGPCWLTPAF